MKLRTLLVVLELDKFFTILNTLCINTYFSLLHSSFSSPWSYVCQNETCIKQEAIATRETQLRSCKLICGTYGGLWPKPTGKVVLSTSTTPFYPWNIQLAVLQCSSDACVGSTSVMKADVAQLLRNAFSFFKKTMTQVCRFTVY